MLTTSRQATSKTTTTDGLIDLAHRYGICVYWRRLARGRRGQWDARTRSIWLDPDLSDRATRSLLAHELGHAALGHSGPQDAHGEEAAWEWAAQFLVDRYTYAVAECTHGTHVGALSDVLDLSREVITAYRRTLERTAA